MRRVLQLLLCLMSACLLAGCAAWGRLRVAAVRAEIRRIEEDWGVQSRLRILEKKRIWEESIYGR